MSQVRRLDQLPTANDVSQSDQIAVWQSGRTKAARILDITESLAGPAAEIAAASAVEQIQNGPIFNSFLPKTGDGSNVTVTTAGGTARSLTARANDVIWAADYGVVAGTVQGMDVPLQAAIDASIAQKKRLVLPPGDIRLSTAKPSGLTERGLGPYFVKAQAPSGWVIEGAASGTTRLVTPGVFGVALWVNEGDHIAVRGISGYCDPTSMPPDQFAALLLLYSVRDFLVEDIETEGYKGSIIHGNFQFNGRYSRIRQKIENNGSSGFDVAAFQNVVIERHTVTGKGGGQGFQHISDPPNANQAYNKTGIALAGGRSNGLRVLDGDYSGLATPCAISEIDDVWVQRCDIHDNMPATGDFLAGLTLAAASSTPMRNINVTDNIFRKNGSLSGTGGTRGGLLLNSNNAPIFASVKNNGFFDNNNAGIVNFGPSVSLEESGNRFGNIDTAYQTVDYSGAPLLTAASSSGFAVRPGASLLYGAYNAFGAVNYTPVLTSAGAITAATVSGRYVRIANLVWVRIVIVITTNGTGAFPLRATLPFTANGPAMLAGGETASQGVAEFGEILAAGLTVSIKTVAGAYPGGDGRTLVVSGFYEAVT